MKKLSRYEQNKGLAYKQMQLAIADEHKYVDLDDYVVTLRNVTSNYTVSVTVTDDGDFADYIYDLECRFADECSKDIINKGDTYIVTLSRYNGYIYDMLTYQMYKQPVEHNEQSTI